MRRVGVLLAIALLAIAAVVVGTMAVAIAACDGQGQQAVETGQATSATIPAAAEDQVVRNATTNAHSPTEMGLSPPMASSSADHQAMTMNAALLAETSEMTGQGPTPTTATAGLTSDDFQITTTDDAMIAQQAGTDNVAMSAEQMTTAHSEAAVMTAPEGTTPVGVQDDVTAMLETQMIRAAPETWPATVIRISEGTMMQVQAQAAMVTRPADVAQFPGTFEQTSAARVTLANWRF